MTECAPDFVLTENPPDFRFTQDWLSEFVLTENGPDFILTEEADPR